MPRLSDSMEEGTILRWMKSEGDEVAVGDELVEIETDKANMVYESDAAGTLTEIVAEEGATLPIGEVIARVGEAGEASGDGARRRRAKKAKKRVRRSEERAAPGGDGNGGAPERSRSEPAAAPAATAAPPAEGGRRRRPRQGVPDRAPHRQGSRRRPRRDLGLGPRRADRQGRRRARRGGRAGRRSGARRRGSPPLPTAGARERPETAKGEVEVVELTKLQQTVARRMAESKATAPHFYLTAEADMTRAWEARARIKAAAGEGEVVPSFNDLVVKACAIALREFPRANGAYRDGRVEMYSRVNVGVAVAAQDALVVPTVFDADLKGLRQIATETRALAARVREGTITPPELSGGTFTVSNLGMYGVTAFSAVINPPQAAILAVGAIDEKPVVRDGEITTARLMAITLACDHRVLYGSDGAEFLARVRDLLEEPLGLAL